MKWGLIARMDKSGLGNQTKNIAEMLNPSKVMVIDSTKFNKANQYPGLYKKHLAYKNYGFLNTRTSMSFMRNLEAVFTCETFYNNSFISEAKQLKVKTFMQYNYEFLDHLIKPHWPLPTYFISPSYWMLEEMQQRYDNVIYLPPPTNETAFAAAKNINLNNNHKKFLHIVGKQASNDRNGTEDLIDSLRFTNSDFTLCIKSQAPLPYVVDDPRVIFDYSNPNNEAELYSGYDAMILPRRYAGLCLPMNEALMSGLPVIMSDISPNNKVLPSEWLVKAEKVNTLITRTPIDVHRTDPMGLAKKIDWLCEADITQEKKKAYKIGFENYSFEVLRPKYEELLGL